MSTLGMLRKAAFAFEIPKPANGQVVALQVDQRDLSALADGKSSNATKTLREYILSSGGHL